MVLTAIITDVVLHLFHQRFGFTLKPSSSLLPYYIGTIEPLARVKLGLYT